MNSNHITIFVPMSDEEKLLEKKLERKRQDISNKINLARQNQVPYGDYSELVALNDELYCSIRDLKGGVYADMGQRLPQNPQELAQAILTKAEKVAKLEVDFIDERLEFFRKELSLMKDRIEKITLLARENKLDVKFGDFNRVISYWYSYKEHMAESPERSEPSFGVANSPLVANNLIGYCIKQLWLIEANIGDLNLHKQNGTQADALISECKIVMAAQGANTVFKNIFLMGQYAGNLNNINQSIEALINRERSKRAAASKSDWANILSQHVYLNYWVNGKVPTANEVEKEFTNLVLGRSTKTISDQLTKQRKLYSNIDKRVPSVNSKGRNKKV